MLCNNGFTNKNNCKRHIHKQHPDVPIKFITICIYGTDAGEVHDNTVEDVGRISAGHQPHSFTFPHKYQAPAGISGLRAASCYITSPPIVKVKQEAMEDDDQDQPLDFSTKSSGGKSTNQKSKKDEQRPIDLSGPSSSQLPFQVPGFAVPGMIHPAALLGQQSLAHLSGGHLSTGAMNLAGQAQNNALSQRLMLRQRLIETSRLNHSIALQKEQELLNNASNNATLGTTSGSKSILPQVSNYDLLSSSAIRDYLSPGDGLTDGLSDRLAGGAALGGFLHPANSLLSAMNPALHASLAMNPVPVNMHALESYYGGLGLVGLDLVGRCLVD